jgi:hypothetical protein
MNLLVGGDSLAYSPLRGEFSELLTLTGSDAHPRVGGLDLLRSIVAASFDALSFDFELDTRATRVALGEDRDFRVEVCRAGKPSCFTSERLVLALGHTLREVTSELRPYVIRGGGELCTELARALPLVSGREACLDSILERYRKVNGEVIRIGLVGLGASTFEVLKVFETLLREPDEYSPKYRLPMSGTPVEFVLYDSHLAGATHPYQRLLKLLLERLAIPREADVVQAVRDSNKKVAERFIKFCESKQIHLEPSRFDWDEAGVSEGFVVATRNSSVSSNQLSLVIDCAPFEEGIGVEQRALFKELKMVDLQEVKPRLWKVKDIDPSWRGRLAFAGASVLPRWRWNVDQMKEDAKEIIGRFYGAPARTED